MNNLDIKEYTVKKKIYDGIFGNTFLITNNKTNNNYVAKVYENYIDNIYTPQIINTLFTFKHPAIINIIGHSTIDFNNYPNPVLITEFCENNSLEYIIDLNRKSLGVNEWNETKKLIAIYGIASGMNFLHKHNILHRDLKPGNILLDKNFYPKINDFDLSINKISKFSELVGTSLYIAPEIWLKNEYSKASDVYSFSMIVFEIMTDLRPYHDFTEKVPTIHEINQKVTNNIRPEIKPGYHVPISYQNLIKNCWDQDPIKRPSFEQIIEKLESEYFITPLVDQNEFQKYIFHIKETYNYKFNEINYIDRPLTQKLIDQFKMYPELLKYFVIQEAKTQISILKIHYEIYQNIDLRLDIQGLKGSMANRYLALSRSSSDDFKAQTIIKDIMETIDDEYKHLCDKLKSKKKLYQVFII